MRTFLLRISIFLCLPMLLAAQTRDSVEVVSQNGCCFDLVVKNRNSGRTPIDDFHISVITPGVNVSLAGPLAPSAPSPWTVVRALPDSVAFSAPAAGAGFIRAGMQLSGFRICFDVGTPMFSIRWKTTRSGSQISSGTLRLQCPVTCDEVGTRQTGGCCFDLTIRNRNSLKAPTGDFHLKLITPGVVFQPSPTAPGTWTVASSSSTEVNYAATIAPLTPGTDLSGFGVCFAFPAGPVPPSFRVVWQTTNSNVVICEDTLTLQCAAQQSCDSVEFTQNTTGQCCYDVTLKNRHTTSAGPLNDLHLRILTPGIRFRTGSVSGPWSITTSTASEVNFASSTGTLVSGGDLSGFKMCFDKDPGAPQSFLLEWVTTLNGQSLCADHVILQCGSTTGQCDTVRTKALDNCCYDFTVFNRHQPMGLLDRFSVHVLTPGVSIVQPGSAPSGWTTSGSNQDSIFFETTGAPIGNGQSLSGFRVCFDTSPPVTAFRLLWRTYRGTQLLCENTFYVRCNEDPPPCDSVRTVSALDSCCYDIGIKNRHWPQSPINDVHFRILSPGTSFGQNPMPPNGWAIQMQSPDVISFATQISPINFGRDLSGFRFCFDMTPLAQGKVAVLWQTTTNGSVICEDTLYFDCNPTPVPCDSVEVERRIPNCCFDFRVKNRHNGPIDDLHFTVITAGVEITSAASSAPGWMAALSGNTSVVFITNSHPIPAGLEMNGFRLCFGNPPGTPPVSTFRVVWQTTLQGKIICQDTLTLVCGETQGCDSLIGRRVRDCSFDFQLRNRHQPAGITNDLHLRVLTPGVTIMPGAAAPPNWMVTGQTASTVNFGDTTGAGLPSGGDLGGFNVSFGNITGPGGFRVEWCSTLNGNVICCDTLVLQCPPSPSRCDSVRHQRLPNCCYSFDVLNRHTPAGSINDWHLRVLTPGVTIRPTPVVPSQWSVSSLTANKVDFLAAGTTNIPSGGNQAGFRICFDNIPPPGGSFRVEWCTTSNGNVICCDTLVLQCPVEPMGCDSVRYRQIQECCFDLTVQNRHAPAGRIDDFHVRVLTPGITILPTPIAPSSWTTDSWNSGEAKFSDHSGIGIVPGGQLGGFVLCFDNLQPTHSVSIEWCTTLQGRVVCCDTMDLSCIQVGIEEIPGPVPSRFILDQNYPNPFNSSTVIEFEVPQDGHIDLEVFDASGKSLVFLVKSRLEAGRYAVRFDASTLPSGTLYYRMKAKGFIQTRPMILLK